MLLKHDGSVGEADAVNEHKEAGVSKFLGLGRKSSSSSVRLYFYELRVKRLMYSNPQYWT
jgi:hypothetical protein